MLEAIGYMVIGVVFAIIPALIRVWAAGKATAEEDAPIVVPKEESLWPVQVSIEEFMMRVAGNEDVEGKPVIWTQWPKEAKPPKS